MARPTDPAALAALRARQAEASRRYRARQRQAQATQTNYAPRHGGGIVDAARAHAEALRVRRAEILAQLPDVRNPRANIRPAERTARAEGPPLKTKAGQERRARAIRDRANAEKVEGIGRARKASLRAETSTGPIADQLQEMGAFDLGRFQDLIARITRGSAQSLGILFEHVGGQKIYSAAIERILYKASREEGFDLLETLAEYAESAAREYAPSRIGRLTI